MLKISLALESPREPRKTSCTEEYTFTVSFFLYKSAALPLELSLLFRGPQFRKKMFDEVFPYTNPTISIELGSMFKK